LKERQGKRTRRLQKKQYMKQNKKSDNRPRHNEIDKKSENSTTHEINGKESTHAIDQNMDSRQKDTNYPML